MSAMAAKYLMLFFWMFHSASGLSAGKDLECHDYRGKKNKPMSQTFGDGFQIKVNFIPGRDVSLGKSCAGHVYNKNGQEILTIEGHSIVFDQESSKLDFNGDESPDFVFKTNTTGAEKCCWMYSAFAVKPSVSKIVDIDQKGFVEFKQLPKTVRVARWEPGPFGFTSMAKNPYAKRYYEIRKDKLEDVTKDLCDEIWADLQGNAGLASTVLNVKNISAMRSQTVKGDEKEEFRSAVLTVALQHVFCRNIDMALDILSLWPDKNAEDVKRVFAKNVEGEFPEVATRLRKEAK